MSHRYRDREPDIDAVGFKLWQLADEEGRELADIDEQSGVLTIDESKGEEMYESRVYRAALPGYSVVFISKTRADGKVFSLMKAKKPDGECFMSSSHSKGWISREEYAELIQQFEELAASLFDTAHPQVTEGRLYNLYAKGRHEREQGRNNRGT